MELSEEAVQRMKESLGETPDPKRQWGYIRHKLIGPAGHQAVFNHNPGGRV
jgi:hypothetical protein